MTPQHHLPADIERTSMSIITEELAQRQAGGPAGECGGRQAGHPYYGRFRLRAKPALYPRCGGSRHCRACTRA